MLQGFTLANGPEQSVIPLGEIGFDAHQEHRHPGNDRQVREEDRQVIQDRGAQRADDDVRSAGVEPEDELVDPDAKVIEKPGHQQADKHLAALKEIEGHQFLGTVFAQDVVEKQEQQRAVPDQQRQQQARYPQEAQQVCAYDHQRVAHQHHQQDAVIGFHPREEDDHHPQVAQHHEVRQHQQPVHQRLIEQHAQHNDTQQPGTNGDQQQHTHQIGQDLIVLVLEQTVGNEPGEKQLQAAREDQRTGHQVRHRHQELPHQRIGHDTAQADDPHQHHADDRQHPGTGADQPGINVGMQGRGVGIARQDLAEFEANPGHLTVLHGGLIQVAITLQHQGFGVITIDP
ncbi:hypothetical protein D3C73_878620 [compost metagenome]